VQVTLEVRSGEGEGREVGLRPGQTVKVGRFDKADFVVREDAMLSNLHFALECREDGCRLRDLGSRFGTFLNKQRVTEAALQDGDWIQAGKTVFRVRVAGAAAKPASLSPPTLLDFDAEAERRPPAPPTPGLVPTMLDLDLEAPAAPPAPLTPARAGSSAAQTERLLERLRRPPQPLYALLDAARDDLVYALLQTSKEQYQSLYEGPKGERLAAVAPYLVRLPPESPLLEPLARQGWGKSWGVYLTSPQPFAEVRRHFRRFLLVRTEAGEELYFRFYDPRVLRAFLPTCLPAEAAAFFGPVTAYWVEAEEPALLVEFTNPRQGLTESVRVLVPIT
jgi:hypothetical protein